MTEPAHVAARNEDTHLAPSEQSLKSADGLLKVNETMAAPGHRCGLTK